MNFISITTITTTITTITTTSTTTTVCEYDVLFTTSLANIVGFSHFVSLLFLQRVLQHIFLSCFTGKRCWQQFDYFKLFLIKTYDFVNYRLIILSYPSN